jgi:hypothetical protein
VTLTRVQSSNIAAIGYDAGTRTLVVRYKPNARLALDSQAGPGTTYTYAPIDAEVFTAIMADESKGGALHRLVIRTKHPELTIAKLGEAEAAAFVEETQP